MKKFLTILLLLIYGASVSGMTLHLHYCCGKLKKINFTSQSKDCGDGMDHKMSKRSCCDNKELSINIKGEQNPVKVFQVPFFAIAMNPEASPYSINTPISVKKLVPEVFAPPPLQKDLNKLYCIYRI